MQNEAVRALLKNYSEEDGMDIRFLGTGNGARYFADFVQNGNYYADDAPDMMLKKGNEVIIIEHTVIEPKYVYAMNFWNGRAVVCKGEWTTVEKKGKLQYWCENEGWGVIDQQDREIVPCRFDELYEIEGTDRLYFVHEGGWDNGHFAMTGFLRQ